MTKSDLIIKDKEILKLKDGRIISYSVYGKEGGEAILFCHGVNGTRVQASKFVYEAYNKGLLIFTPDRPGYGDSTPMKNRDYIEWAVDMNDFLNILNINKSAILGLSAGANYALACLYKYPKRFGKAVMVSATSGAFRYRRGPEKKIAEIILSHPSLVNIYMNLVYKTNINTKESKFNIQKVGLSDADWALFNKLDIPSLMELSEKEAFVNGPEAPASDVLRMLKDIDFDSKSIQKQVSFWYGAHDRIVPLETMAFIEMIIPKYKLVIKSDAGHLLIFQHMKEILGEFV